MNSEFLFQVFRLIIIKHIKEEKVLQSPKYSRTPHYRVLLEHVRHAHENLEELLTPQEACHQTRRIPFNNRLKNQIPFGLIHAPEVVRYRNKPLHLAVVLGLDLFDGRPELYLLPESQLHFDLGHILIQSVQTQLVLVLQHFVKLTVPVGEPRLHVILREAHLNGLANHLPNLEQIVLPLLLLPEQIGTDQRDHRLRDLLVQLPQLAILR